MSYKTNFHPEVSEVILHLPLFFFKYYKCGLIATLQLQDAQVSGSVFVPVKVSIIGSEPESFVTAVITLQKHNAWHPIWNMHISKSP